MTLINGQQSAQISSEDRGLLYGDGLFETIAVRAGSPQLWDRHMQRLSLGCARLGIALPDLINLRKEAHAVCHDAEQAVLKIIVTRGSGARGYRCRDSERPTRILALQAWPDYPADFTEQGVAVRVCATRLGSNPLLAGLKHLNRLEQVLARNEWDDPAVPEGLMLDSAGQVVEGTMSNVFLVRGGMLQTPDLSQCGVAGIMRGRILEMAADMGLTTGIIQLDLKDIMEAQEIFLCNSLIGLWPVREVARIPIPRGPVTQRIAACLNETLNNSIHGIFRDEN
ncbi:MAG: aminodeoxychorismate lyase [Gammaproteobacteria bacterium]